MAFLRNNLLAIQFVALYIWFLLDLVSCLSCRVLMQAGLSLSKP